MKFQTLLICLMLLTLVGCVQQKSIRDGTINWQPGQRYVQVRSDEHCTHWLEATDHLGAICSFAGDVSRAPVQFYFERSTLAKVRIELYQGNSPEAAGEAYGLGFDWLKASAGGVDDPSMEVKDKSGKKPIPYSSLTGRGVSHDYVNLISLFDRDSPKRFSALLFQRSEHPVRGMMLCNSAYRSMQGIFFVDIWVLDAALFDRYRCPVSTKEIEANRVQAPEISPGLMHK